ncbi:MAG: hypothetical protein J6K51_05090 [Clostridia bacterium]|nr:hypothetical protein [Clostridia bacterium]
MFKISSKVKHGGIWDGNRVVKELETDNAALAEQLKAQGCTVEEVEDSLDKLNVAQLKKYAKDNGIDLGEATTKEAILEVINTALSANPNE